MTVSLNRGTVRIQLGAKNNVSTDQIRRVVTKSGFTPKQARVNVEGRLTQEDQALVLTVGKTQYPLTPAPSASDKWAALAKLSTGEPVRIEGLLVSEPTKPTIIELTDFEVLPGKSRTK